MYGQWRDEGIILKQYCSIKIHGWVGGGGALDLVEYCKTRLTHQNTILLNTNRILNNNYTKKAYCIINIHQLDSLQVNNKQ